MLQPNNAEQIIDNANQSAENAGSGNANQNGGDKKETVPLATFLSLKDELKTYKEQLDEFKKLQQQQEEAKLTEQGDLKKLLDLKESELTETKSRISQLETKANAYDALETQERLDAKTKLGDKWDDVYNTIPIAALRKIISTVSIPNAANFDGGGGSKPKPKELTDEQKADAKAKGLTDEAYLRMLETRKKLKGEK
jgi:hypothetical protein